MFKKVTSICCKTNGIIIALFGVFLLSACGHTEAQKMATTMVAESEKAKEYAEALQAQISQKNKIAEQIETANTAIYRELAFHYCEGKLLKGGVLFKDAPKDLRKDYETHLKKTERLIEILYQPITSQIRAAKGAAENAVKKSENFGSDMDLNARADKLSVQYLAMQDSLRESHNRILSGVQNKLRDIYELYRGQLIEKLTQYQLSLNCREAANKVTAPYKIPKHITEDQLKPLNNYIASMKVGSTAFQSFAAANSLGGKDSLFTLALTAFTKGLTGKGPEGSADLNNLAKIAKNPLEGIFSTIAPALSDIDGAKGAIDSIIKLAKGEFEGVMDAVMDSAQNEVEVLEKEAEIEKKS